MLCNGTMRRRRHWAFEKGIRTVDSLPSNATPVCAARHHTQGKTQAADGTTEIFRGLHLRGYALPSCEGLPSARCSPREHAPFMRCLPQGMPFSMRGSIWSMPLCAALHQGYATFYALLLREYASMRCSSYEYALCAAFFKVCHRCALPSLRYAPMRCLR